MEALSELVVRAQAGDVDAYARLVQATQRMVYAVALSVLRDSAAAQDAAQQAYLRAFRRLPDLDEPAAFAGWLRRIVITVALNMRRSRRTVLLPLDDIPDVPVLDESETRWSEAQRQRLAAALLTLTPEERQVCDRRYHGSWTIGRLADQARVDAEALWLDDRASFDPWQMTGRVFESVNRLFPGRSIKVVPTQYQMCTQAWEIEVEDEGRWFEVLAWGVFTDRIVRHLGADPERHTAVSVGYGLERLAMLRYGGSRSPASPERAVEPKSSPATALTHTIKQRMGGGP